MKLGIYPGSFNPIHKGHLDILGQALLMFDKVLVAFPGGGADTKELSQKITFIQNSIKASIYAPLEKRIFVTSFEGLLVDWTKDIKADAVIRGLRNGTDLEYEKSMLYWNQDLGLLIPTVFFITSRDLVHYSSTAIRTLTKIKASSGSS
jgi:pantetheine-phosphate adenylyltransferase